ncbi:ribonuclease Y [Nocardioides caldifontis]|uniref:ribonuclease Y n=1 Tax=Nocardioides caldifontis TaxID=2588938 RepID=UPI0011DF4C64|nr:ribonuclease Y [Nocardioides caldifontis]
MPVTDPTASPDQAARLAVPAATGVDLTVVVVGLVVLLPLLCLGVLLLSRHLATRREEELHRDLQEQRLDIERREHRLAEREARLDAEVAALGERLRVVEGAEEERRRLLEHTALLTAEEARAELMASIEHEARLQAALTAREIEKAATEEAETKARRIITGVVQRLASEQTVESSVSVVQLPSDDMKGRIIGREGRNIRAFEQITGVNVVIDDTPGAVVLSCFDPVRREVGRVTLEALVADGRIHPSRIEEVHRRAEDQVEELCRRAGEDACLEMGISDLHPELVLTMGRLNYRTSYGQNVLRHLVESGHIAGMLASELGLDRTLCVRAAFLHDIGKALTHEAEGSHAIVGAELARKHGESEDVAHAIEAHHNEVEPRTVEAVLTQAADAISGARPGARREALDAYLHRLHRLEEIAMAKPGVEKVFAMQAGRDVRVMVKPEEVDDLGAQMLARDIAKEVEAELTYPGQIKVTVVRESRATEVAR